MSCFVSRFRRKTKASYSVIGLLFKLNKKYELLDTRLDLSSILTPINKVMEKRILCDNFFNSSTLGYLE